MTRVIHDPFDLMTVFDLRAQISRIFWNYKVDVPSQWSFRPKSAWGSIETTTIVNTHPTLVIKYH